jgi:hypothetical protein
MGLSEGASGSPAYLTHTPAVTTPFFIPLPFTRSLEQCGETRKPCRDSIGLNYARSFVLLA